MQVNEIKEQLLSVEFNAVRDADVADVPAGPRGFDRLHHRLLGADAFQHGEGAYLHVFNKPAREVALVSMDLTCLESMPVDSAAQTQ